MTVKIVFAILKNGETHLLKLFDKFLDVFMQ